VGRTKEQEQKDKISSQIITSIENEEGKKRTTIRLFF